MDSPETKATLKLVKATETLNSTLKSIARTMEFQNKILGSYFDKLDALEQDKKDVTFDYIKTLIEKNTYSPDEIREKLLKKNNQQGEN